MTIYQGDIKVADVTPFTLQDIFDAVHPIGEVYYQVVDAPEPEALYNSASISSTWEDITTTYDGRYLKPDSTAAVGTNQAEQLPNIKGTVDLLIYAPATPSASTPQILINSANLTGAFNSASAKSRSGGLLTNNACGSSTSNYNILGFDASGSNSVYTDSGKVRPLTSTIKIWQRTA